MIIPAILETDFSMIGEKLTKVAGVSKRVQLDICDGVFVDGYTWPYAYPATKGIYYDDTFKEILDGVAEMPLWDSFLFDLDLMVSNPLAVLSDLLAIGPDRIIIHLASLQNPEKDLSAIRLQTPGLVSIGLAVMPDTKVEDVAPYIESGVVSFIQCMGISEIGKQGQTFNENVLSLVEGLRSAYSDLSICIDGGVNDMTAKRLVDAGATDLVTGSFLWHSDSPVHALQELSDTIQA